MEAVGAGANVLAFAILGLKSAKVIYETLSGIKDGPRIVQQVAQDILQLHWILENVKKSQVVTRDLPLQGQVQECSMHLETIAIRVQSLQFSPSDKTTGRIWKRLKCLLNEKDLEKVHGQVNNMVTLLSLRLNISLSELASQAKSSMHRIEKRVGALDTSIQQRLGLQTTELSQLSDTLLNSVSNQKIIQENFESVENTIQASNSMQMQDNALMQKMILELPTKMAELIFSHQSSLKDNRKFLTSPDHLYNLVSQKAMIDTHTEDDELGESVIEDLQEVLRSFLEDKDPAKRSACGKAVEGLAEVSFENGIRRLRRGFGSGTLSINVQDYTETRHHYSTAIQQIRTLDQKDFDIGKLSLMISKRQWTTSEEPGCTIGRKGRKVGNRTDYSLSLTFLPKDTQNQRILVASLIQRQTPQQGISSISTLMINRCVPSTSPVFDVIRQGNLYQLQQMFRDGTASPRDHDENGASLLMYATYQPEICKFLITCGIDIDHVAIGEGVDSIFSNKLGCALQMFHFNDCEEEPEVLDQLNQCRKLLLEAGADPTISLGNETESFLHDITTSPTPESLRIAWNPEWVGPFENIHHPTFNSKSVFLTCCENYSKGYTAEIFQTLLSLGANINDRDINGHTCLHTCIIHLNRIGPHLRQYNAIKYLVERGADPLAESDYGFSVTELAYDPYLSRHDLRSYPGDLWDAVLQSCGFDLVQFRSLDYRRKARYTNNYSRVDFETLWLGRETECPYWDDKPWPPLEAGEMESSDDGTSSEDDTSSDGEFGSENEIEGENETGGEDEIESEDELGNEGGIRIVLPQSAGDSESDD